MLRVATWNVNSIKARLEGARDWLQSAGPDVVCLQELKCQTEAFPSEAIEDLGYNCAVVGQKSYNGVAILSKQPFEEVALKALPGAAEADEPARYVEAVISAEAGPVRIASIYLPNGNPAPGAKFDYKLAWMERLKRRAEALLAYEEPVILGGDYNVIPRDVDVHDPSAWAEDALFQPEARAAFYALKWLGYADAYELADGRAHQYTFWDYQGGAWTKNHGIRIDHLLLSPQAADRLNSVEIDKDVRAKPKASDHTPVIAQLDL